MSAKAKTPAKAKPKKTVVGKKKAAAKTVQSVGDLPTVKHLTDRYKPDGHPKGSNATRVTEKRQAVRVLVASGKATIGQIRDDYGLTGLAVIARYIRAGNYAVKGFSADPGYVCSAKDSPAKNHAVALKLEKLNASTAVKQSKVPTILVK
jgi:hypothetical protein